MRRGSKPANPWPTGMPRWRFRLAAVVSSLAVMPAIVSVTSIPAASAASALTSTPVCNTSIPHQVSCTYLSRDLLIQALETGICFTWSKYGPAGNNYEVIDVVGGNGNEVLTSVAWTGDSYQKCLSLPGNQYSGYGTIEGQKASFRNLVAGGGIPTGGNDCTFASTTAGIAAVAIKGVDGYFITDTAGQVCARGSAVWQSDLNGVHLNAPIIAIEATPDGAGYWLLGADGGIFTLGDAHFYGSTGNIRLNAPVVGMAVTPTNKGYSIVAKDGGTFTSGDTRFHGSTGNIRLNQPVDGIAVAPGGNDYWLVASDGGVFTFTPDGFHGSLGATRLNKPIVGMSSTPNGKGYAGSAPTVVSSASGMLPLRQPGNHTADYTDSGPVSGSR